jgi:hypothetical protein
MTYYQLAKEKHERITWSANWSLSFFLSADNLWYQVQYSLQVLYYKEDPGLSFGRLRGLFMAVSMTISAAVSDFGGQRYHCLV